MGGGTGGIGRPYGGVGMPSFGAQSSPYSLPPGAAEGMTQAIQSSYGYGVPQVARSSVDMQPQAAPQSGQLFGANAQQRGLLGPAPAGPGMNQGLTSGADPYPGGYTSTPSFPGEQAKGRPAHGTGGGARALFAPSPQQRIRR